MIRQNLWKILFVVLVVLWSLYELYPPKGKDIILEFQRRAVKRDAEYTNIVTRLKELQAAYPDRAFGNLVEAVGTNDITRYFPYFPEAKAEANPSRFVLNRLQRESAGRIKLGLDLQGGTSFLVAMDTNALSATADHEFALSQAVEVLRKRVDKFGVAEPIIQPAGSDRILVQLPGLSDADKESAKRQIERAAFLEFRLVHPQSKDLIDAGMIEPGYEVLREERVLPDGRKEIASYLVRKKPSLTGEHVRNAYVTREQLSNKPEIAFNLDSEGARIFGEVTSANVGRELAIVLDGVLYSAPVINGPILGGSGVIQGRFEIREAVELANVLENPLQAPVKIIESREVDPSLGRDTIESGIKAVLIGTIAICLFMLVYYMWAGLIANMALMLNIVILLGVMCYVQTTFTLPGIAGIVLTIGMAVDANVLIFERIREELAAGKSMRGAVSAGYGKAFSTIFDSNITTLICSIILIFMGTGPVKGFGVALTIGVSVSMFTALVVTRLIFDYLLSRNLLKSLPMLSIVHGTKFDFMKWSMPAFIASWALILIGNGYGIFVRGHEVLGPDFAGGDQQTYAFTQRVDVDKLRSAIGELKVGEPSIQYQKDIGNNVENLRVTTAFDTADKVEDALKSGFPEAKFKLLALDKVGPTVGKEIRKTAIIASLLAMFFIMVYVAFRYEFSFAVGAIIAILHDILMTAGWFFLTGRELSAPIVAAFLTIIGFSINDTIVIFDRIREDLKLGVRGSFRDVMNQALNQTLSRTIITSGTVFLATLSLYIFGGGVVNDFAFTFLVGILTGTYSSIYIACFVVLKWHKGQRPALGSGSQVTMDQARGTVASARA